MGGTSILAAAVEAARAGTEFLQSDVIHEAWIGQDALGAPSFAAPIIRKALVVEGAFHFQRPDGQVITTKARVGFVGPVEPNGAPGRQEPIDPRDEFMLRPDGPRLKSVGVPAAMLDPLTGAPYSRTVWLA